MTGSGIVTTRRALLSVSDKTGLADLGRALHALGVEIVSTGGSARVLREAGVPVREVGELTGFPEIMDGRVKTLHPKVHGGLLGRRGTDDAVMREHAIAPIDLLVVNLYPFARTIADAGATYEEAIEQIDIGGPAMLRAGAKNHERVTVVCDPADYPGLIETLRRDGGSSFDQRRRFAAKVFAHTARYDGMIADWLSARAEGEPGDSYPPTLHLALRRAQEMRYGENPHQAAALYFDGSPVAGTVAGATVLAGREMSYNNLVDADTALECVKAFDKTPACVIVKHANPCGVALGKDSLDAYQRAFACDATSAFGGIIAMNRPIDGVLVEHILAKQFVEVLVAPSFDEAALAALRKKPNVRALATGEWPAVPGLAQRQLRSIAGGILVQDSDIDTLMLSDLKVVTRRVPDTEQLRDLLFAWHVAMFVKSNAIVYAKDGVTVGIGAGQMSRVISVKIAAMKAADAKLSTEGSVMASDAFFPFRDNIDLAAGAGVRAIIQPGGSMRDQEVIDAANEHDMAMVFTGTRHFRH
ncbi:MAG: bifunctional phosphoribosylaminoimidazolecarboxamide formyltransferase/IMP cyclohydrolase [Rhodanobacteraceae bacterium]|jgi:phosphoribosylaminoimidazolecarboxamide formyltransferase/IMP cyclohydrolase|nr:MAG: bifunctional phosphoribosylaminoimidazolecarboxamide formyltransferase/IMP cyclohydrolase [Rhodanobacteraceae bacterium]